MLDRTIDGEMLRKRINDIIKENRLNNNSFAVAMGVDSSNFSKKVKGELTFTKKDLAKFSEGNLNIDYLLYGSGSPYTGSFPPSSDYTALKMPQDGIPVYDEEFACGFKNFADAATHPIGFAKMPGTTGATCWCKASGESMAPVITGGNYVCLKKIEDWKMFIVYGEIYAIDTFNDVRTIKKIEHGEKENELLLVPINKDYSPQSINISSIRNLFKVVSIQKVL